MKNEQAEAWARAFGAAGIEMATIVKVLREIAEATIIAYMEFEKAMVQVANIAREGLAETEKELEELEAIEKEAALWNLPAARNRKMSREKQRTVERTTDARFRQYKASESAWNVRKRTGQRRREWRGPWKEN